MDALLGSKSLSAAMEAVAATGYRFGCCDAEEVGFATSRSQRLLGVEFGGRYATPPEIMTLFAEVNAIAKAHFGRKYSLPIPLVKKDR